VGTVSQGCRSRARFALRYHLSGFRPFQFEPCCLGCYGDHVGLVARPHGQWLCHLERRLHHCGLLQASVVIGVHP
jgi:hypothetical protein